MTTTVDLIDRYFAAASRHDVDAIVSLFAATGVVVDDGDTHHGTNEIRDWRAGSASQYEYTTTLIRREPAGDHDITVTARLEGNFPGSVVDLQHEFHTDDGFIEELRIFPSSSSRAPTENGALARQGDPKYAAATASFNLAVQRNPDLATTARTSADIITSIDHARRTDMQVRVSSTGHGATAAAPTDGSLLIRPELTGGVRVDPHTRTAIVQAGTTWGTVVEAAAEHGLIAAHGSAASVGAVGYLLRGGVSFYGRQLGLAVNSLQSISIVGADGREVLVSDEEDSEFFWALRGGGGGFGVVTKVQIALHPMSAILTGATVWDAKHAAEIATRWAQWTLDAPRNISTSLRLMNLPAAPGLPFELTGGQILVIDGAVTSPDGHAGAHADSVAADLLAPLLAIAPPLLQTWHTGPPGDLLHTHMDPPEPLPYAGNHILLEELNDDGVEQFVAAAGPGSGPPLMIAELRQLGGAFADPDRAGGALDRTPARFAHIAIGVVPPSRTAASVAEDLRRVADALAPWNTGLTIPSVVEGYGAAQRTFSDRTAADVAAVRRRVDPDAMFAGDVDPIRDHGLSSS